MTLNDPLANVLSAIQNAERRGERRVSVANSSRLITGVLAIMERSGYIAGFSTSSDSWGESVTITLNGKINRVGVIKPRFRVGKDGFERFEKRFLPAKGFGILVVSTNQGLLTHEEAKDRGVGGALISYCY